MVGPRTASARTRAEVLEYVPAKLEVHVYVRPKYACRYCKDGVMSPPPPVRPIARGIAGPGLIAQIIVGKFGDHLPLYRQEDFFTRHGLHIPRSTLCDWVQAAAELLRPLYQRQKELVLQVARAVDRRHARDRADGRQRRQSPGTLLDLHRRTSIPTRCTTSPKVAPAMDRPSSLQDSKVTSMPMPTAATTTSIWGRMTRSAKLPAGRMRGASSSTRGTVHRGMRTRSWSGSDSCTTSRIRPASCRPTRGVRFVRAKQNRCSLVSAHASRSWRERALPKSALAKAVWYARNQWQALCRYTEDGRLSIDNNVSERTLRHQAIGRKNWLFLGSQQAGPRAAVLFTILAGAKRHRIEPWTYLRELLLRLHDDDPRLDEMLPDQWAIQHPEAVLTYRLEESRRKAATRSSRRRHTRTSEPGPADRRPHTMPRPASETA